MGIIRARRRQHPSGRPLFLRWRLVPPLVAVIGIAWATWYLRDSLMVPAPLRAGNSAANEAIALLRKMQQAYRQLNSYADRTQMFLRSRRNGRWVTDDAVMEIRWRRPDQLALRVVHGQRQFHVSVFEKSMQARIEDPEFQEFGNQTVVQDQTGELSLAAIYGCLDVVDPREPTVRHSALATLPAPLTLTPLALLLDPQAIDGIIRDATKLELLPTASLRSEPAQRVQIETESGDFVLWIDRATYLLRRIELPQTEGDSAVRQYSLAVDFFEVEINPPLQDLEFRFSGPPDAKYVRHFVLPPAQPAPDSLGAPIQGLEFVDLNGSRVAEEAWKDRIAILVWFSQHPSSRAMLAELEELAANPATMDGCTILAVCTEPTTSMSHGDIADLMREWSVSIRTVRDLHAVGRDILKIERAPTLVILDRDQRLQRLQEGGDDNLSAQLAKILDEVRHDGNLAGATREALELQWQEYRRILAEVTVTRDPA